MTIKELFELAIEYEQIDVQALIMFLVFEKQVHTMDEDVKVLDLYFLEKHRERMTKEINEYKQKMKMKYPADFYVVKTKKHLLYIYAYNKTQAMLHAKTNGYQPVKAKLIGNELMHTNNSFVRLKDLVKNKKAPYLIGKGA